MADANHPLLSKFNIILGAAGCCGEDERESNCEECPYYGIKKAVQGENECINTFYDDIHKFRAVLDLMDKLFYSASNNS